MDKQSGPWSPREYQVDLASRADFGTIAGGRPQPTSTSLYRWLNQLSPDLRKAPFTDAENRHILLVRQEDGLVHRTPTRLPPRCFCALVPSGHKSPKPCLDALTTPSKTTSTRVLKSGGRCCCCQALPRPCRPMTAHLILHYPAPLLL